MKIVNRLSSLMASALLLASCASHAVIFQAEDYHDFFDTTPGNTGGAYRFDNVDIEVTSDSGGGYNIGWIEATEWLVYRTLNIPRSGNYTIKLRVATPNGGTSASVDLNGGSIVLGTANIPNTGGWQNWQTVSISAYIDAGNYDLGVYAQTGGWNLNWIEVLPESGSPGGGIATVFEHCDYTGWSADLDVGNYNLGALMALGFVNDQASSIRVASGYEAVLYQHDNFAGAAVVISADDPCLNNEGFNDRVSSIVVRRAGTNGQPTWSDEFDSIDFNNWSFEVGGGGWGNYELQYYTNGQNASIQYDSQAGSNVLVIEARRQGGFNCWYGACTYTSTRMISKGKKSFRYGRIEARIKLPQTQGIWPAFWMLGNNFDSVGWPHSGEIDIMEHVGFEPNLTHGSLHGPGYSGATPLTGTADLGQIVSANYHVFAIDWNASGITWFVDGRQFYHVSRAQVEQYGPWVYDQPFWLLLNVAVGGTWPGSPDGSSTFPQRMYVDYVRVYQ